MPTLNRATIATAGTTVGLLGGLAAGRRAQRRASSERLLDVAEAYVIALRTALQCVLFAHDGKPRLDECRRLEGELWVLVARIELLYGQGSDVAMHAAEATGALAAIEAHTRRAAHDADDPSLHRRIDAEERCLEREYRAFLHATHAVIRPARRPRTRIRARLQATSPTAPNPKRRPGPRPQAEQPPRDDVLRDLDKALRDLEERQPINEHDAACEDPDARTPPAR